MIVSEATLKENDVKTYTAFRPEILTELRKSSGFTQAEVSDLTGISQGSLSNYEKGIRIPDYSNLIALGRCFNVFFVADWDNHLEDKKQNSPD